MRCRHCGTTAPLTPAVLHQVQQATAVLGQIDARQRQLSASERRAVSSTWGSRVLYLLLAIFILGPFVACGGCGLYWSATSERPLVGFLIMTLLPLTIMLLVVAGGWLWIRRSRRAFALACAAVPPAVTGGNAACHVCGAELATSTEAIVRCSYCSADNVVEPSILDRAARQVVTVLDGYDREVHRQATSVGKASRNASIATVGMGCVVPVVVVTLFFTIEWVLLSDYEAPPLTEVKYAVMPTKHGDCVCSVKKDGNRYFLHYGHLEGVENEFRDSVDDLTLHSAKYFEGKKVRLIDEGKRGTVVRAYGAWHGGVNEVLVKTDGGGEARTTIGGLCFGEAPAPSKK
ncbi:MAG: hypothetical protein JRI23_10840 [Deltaproteobacteria bacterium]|nr:hypothetical protein [Deltaproteobacteria bacterium]MBW2532174.1 hypothetical protein [Deltaproteobacteria bacterium]